MAILIVLLLNSIAVYVTGSILPGVKLDNFLTAVVVAVVLGLINTVIRPILLVLTLPINILTLGLFTFVIMGLMTMLTSWVVPGFYVANFWWAMLFSLVLAIFDTFLYSLATPINR